MSKIIKLCQYFLVAILIFAFFMPAHNIKDSAFAVDENDKITAKAMCTIEKESGRILYAKNENEKLPMASLTKIITAIVVIENTNNLEEVIAIPKEAVGIEGSSIYLKEGEHLSILSLLYGLMLQSGNDCAVALAISTSKSVENFIKLANDFCKKIGATSTNLVTPNGLHDDNHYTTAYDLAKISAYAMKNETFKKIVGTKSIKIEREKGNYPVVIKNKNKLLKNMENATGIKTGYTKKAGRCFVGSAQKNGMEVICVLLNCNPMFQECENLLNKAFDEFSMVNLLDEYKTRNVSVLNGEKPSVLVCSNSGFNFPLKDEEKTNISIIENVPNSINAPIKANESVGEIEIYLKNDLIFCEKIYTIEEVKANDYFSKLKRIIEGF